MQDLLQAIGIAEHRHFAPRQLDLDRHPRRLGRRADVRDRGADRVAQIDAPAAQLDLVLAQARDVEQVVEQERELLGLALDRRQRGLATLVARRRLLEQRGRVQERRQRAAQLVRQRGQELVAHRGRARPAGAVVDQRQRNARFARGAADREDAQQTDGAARVRHRALDRLARLQDALDVGRYVWRERTLVDRIQQLIEVHVYATRDWLSVPRHSGQGLTRNAPRARVHALRSASRARASC